MCNAALSCSTVMLSNPLEIPGLGGIRNMVCGDGVPSGSWLIVFSVFIFTSVYTCRCVVLSTSTFQ